ncbi:hypothetical protein STRIP9103_04674 [Streptomyces ipomoeae 91-03]|uniref:Uncharacterized protein n=1 Tax=Streptomyces ipomoeae 91-03 TaxID=698759 RepID=L1KXF4_9ACTN|nr:hypothetical protein STRIP9103_04674 [Streptomyces ipomoeae 91-03]
MSISGCKIYQQIELRGSPQHDYMRWYTTGDSRYCEAWINDTAHGTTRVRFICGS